jgi:hypothetical protein
VLHASSCVCTVALFYREYLQRMSSSDLRDRMDGLEWETPAGKMDAVYPGSSASVPFHTGVQVSEICMSISYKIPAPSIKG